MSIEYVTIEHMQEVVSDYIYATKGVRVNVDIACKIDKVLNPYRHYQSQVIKLNAAYGVAKEYFRTHEK